MLTSCGCSGLLLGGTLVSQLPITVLEKEGKPPKPVEGNLAYKRLSAKNGILKLQLVAVGM